MPYVFSLVVFSTVALAGLANPVIRPQCRAGVCDDRPVCPRTTCRCVFPSNVDCAVYYQCVEGKPFQYRCSSGLLFNEETLSCDYDFNVNCTKGTTTKSRTTTTKMATTTKTGNDTTTNDNPTTYQSSTSTKIITTEVPNESVSPGEFTETSEQPVSQTTEPKSTFSPTVRITTSATSSAPAVPSSISPTTDSDSTENDVTSSKTVTNNVTTVSASTFYELSTDGETTESKTTNKQASTNNEKTITETSRDRSTDSVSNASTTSAQSTSDDVLTDSGTTTADETNRSSATSNDEPTNSEDSSSYETTDNDVTTNSETTATTKTTGKTTTNDEITSPETESTKGTTGSETTSNDEPTDSETTQNEKISSSEPINNDTSTNSESTRTKKTTISGTTDNDVPASNETSTNNVISTSKSTDGEVSTERETSSNILTTKVHTPTTTKDQTGADNPETTETTVPEKEYTDSSSTQTETSKLTSSPDTAASYTCQSRFGLFPDPKSCYQFYQCSHWMPYQKKCPSNLHFNPSLQVCDWPYRAGCTIEDSSSTPVVNSTTPTEHNTSPSTEFPPSTKAPSSTAIPEETTPGSTNNTCNCDSCDIPIPKDCSSYILCIDRKAIPISCGDGLYYNAFTGTCDLMDNVQCDTDVRCPRASGRFPYPHSCQHFMDCNLDEMEIKKCPEGMNYDKNESDCSWDLPCEDDDTTIAPTETDTPTETPYKTSIVTSTTTDATTYVSNKTDDSTITSFVTSTSTDVSTTASIKINSSTTHFITSTPTDISTTASNKTDSSTITPLDTSTATDVSTTISKETDTSTTHLPTSTPTDVSTVVSRETVRSTESTSTVTLPPTDKSTASAEPSTSTESASSTETHMGITNTSFPTKVTASDGTSSHSLSSTLDESTTNITLTTNSNISNYSLITPTTSSNEISTRYTSGSSVDDTAAFSTESSSSTVNSQLFKCPTRFGLFPDHENCSCFYHCSHWIPHHKLCPSDLHFNPVLQVCDWPYKAGCDLTITTRDETASTQSEENSTEAKKTSTQRDMTSTETTASENEKTTTPNKKTTTRNEETSSTPSNKKSTTTHNEVSSATPEKKTTSWKEETSSAQEEKTSTQYEETSSTPQTSTSGDEDTTERAKSTTQNEYSSQTPKKESTTAQNEETSTTSEKSTSTNDDVSSPTTEKKETTWFEETSPAHEKKTTRDEETSSTQEQSTTQVKETSPSPEKPSTRKEETSPSPVPPKTTQTAFEVSTPTLEHKTTSSNVSSEFKCPSRFGLFPDPASCFHFYQCSHWKEHRKLCPSSLHFNPQLHVCDWPYRAGCGSPVPYPTPSEDDDDIQNQTKCDCECCFFPDKTDCSKYTLCLDGVVHSGHCNDGLLFNSETNNCDVAQRVFCSRNECETPDGFFGNKENCSVFYRCVNGQAFTEKCPAGQHFRDKDGKCVAPCEAGCDRNLDCKEGSGINKAEATPFPTCLKGDGLYPVEDDCSSFYQCSEGERHRIPCPPGLHFNPDYDVCEPPCDAQCDPRIECSMARLEQQPNCTCDNCFLADPTDCSAYHFCSHEKLTRGYCPAGFLFDVPSERCKNETEVNCEANADPAMCPQPYGSYEYPGDCRKFIHCDNSVAHVRECEKGSEFDSESGTCTTSPKGKCGVATHDPACQRPTGLFAHSSNCSLFYQCENGVSFLKSCSPPLVFNSLEEVCDWQENYHCVNGAVQNTKNSRISLPHNNRSQPKKVLQECHEVPGVTCPCACRVPTYDECSSFYHCQADGTACKRHCPEGLFFNKKSMVCDLPHNVECRDFFFSALNTMKLEPNHKA